MRGAAFFALKVTLLSVGLAAVTIFFGPLVAVASVCTLLWAALFLSLRTIRDERLKLDRYLRTVRDKYDSIVGVLCGAMDLQDDMKAQHTSRVGQLASLLAAEMGMRKEEIQLLQKAAILADIGKIEIAESILSKPGALSEQEWKEMKRHPELGHRILTSIAHLRDASDIVLAHHERYDGQGYPRGLKGEEIPLGARVLLVVDAYIAMTSDRPHRKKMGHDMAMKEILRNSLTQFDPEVVRGFVRCEERGQVDATPEPAPRQATSEPARMMGAA
jgi:HD-GYP domain-containing protein (c-di-GMP phosphodiesterase class II)